MKILGIDPSLRSTGFGVIEIRGNEMRSLGCGVIRNKPDVLPSRCLVKIRDEIKTAILLYQPDAVAIEGIVHVQSTRIAITMGHGRAAAILAAAESGLPIYEYAPRKVKASVTGRGTSGKSQVAQMVKMQLGLKELPPEDAADALALAICHAQSTRGIVAQLPSEI
jgi:crossover junction endodeoxyribonuclease RuvC